MNELVLKLKKDLEDSNYKLPLNDIHNLINKHKRIAIDYFGERIVEYKGAYSFKADNVIALIKSDRIVWGGHGPYVEFDTDATSHRFIMPNDKKWRLSEKYNVKYLHYIPVNRSEKIYFQVKRVNYADYRVNKFYIDLYLVKPINL